MSINKRFISTIGKEVKIVWSPNKCQIGIEGVILDDTSNTLVIRCKRDGRILRIGKKGCIFEIKYKDKCLKVSGDELLGNYIRRLSKI